MPLTLGSREHCLCLSLWSNVMNAAYKYEVSGAFRGLHASHLCSGHVSHALRRLRAVLCLCYFSGILAASCASP